MNCQRCGEKEVASSDEEMMALVEEHSLSESQLLVAGVLCADCLADFLAWLQDLNLPS